jgi:hypothetical protein
MVENRIACSAIEQEIEEDGACRFAASPPGLVNAPSGLSEAKQLDQIVSRIVGR